MPVSWQAAVFIGMMPGQGDQHGGMDDDCSVVMNPAITLRGFLFGDVANQPVFVHSPPNPPFMAGQE
jgi:hypothetical protein